jgi:hypothetical protein
LFGVVASGFPRHGANKKCRPKGGIRVRYS